MKTANTTAVVLQFINPGIQYNQQNLYYPVFEEQDIDNDVATASMDTGDSIKGFVDVGNNQDEPTMSKDNSFKTYTNEQ